MSQSLVMERFNPSRVVHAESRGTASVPRQVPKLTRVTYPGVHELMKLTFYQSLPSKAFMQ